ARVAALGTMLAALGGETTGSLREVAATLYVQASLVRTLAAVGLAAAALAARRRDRLGGGGALIGGTALGVGGSGAWASPSAARLGHRGVLLALAALHPLAAAAWIGGLVHLVVAAMPQRAERSLAGLLRRFSSLALAAVAGLFVAGVGLTLAYVDGISAAIGTAYGIMVLTKVLMFGGLL